MLIWKGLGILAGIIPLAIFFLSYLIFGDSDICTGSGLVLSGVLVWLLGRKFNANTKRKVVDKETGQESIQILEHSMFWLKMEYWAPIFILLGVAFLLSNFTQGKSLDMFSTSFLVILFLALLGLGFWQRRKEMKSLVPVSDSTVANHTQKKDRSSLQSKLTKTKKDDKGYEKRSQEKSANAQSNNSSKGDKDKREYYDKLKQNKEMIKEYKPSDHSNYMPK